MHTGNGLVERTIRTIKSLTRANLEDGLTFEESVARAIKTIRQTPHNTLKMTPFQLHHGRKPRTPITNLIGQPTCLLADWKETLTNYILAQPAELQVFTVHDSDGELADYLVLNESRKRGRSVRDNFKSYQFFEKETKPNAIKCRFKTNKNLTAAKEAKHTITTTDGKVIHKKLASNPLKFQPTKKAEEPRKPTNRCTRCGRFSHDDLCDTHKRIRSEQQGQSTRADRTMPTMPIERAEVRPDITVISNSQSSHADELPSTADIDPELTVTAEIKYDAAVKPTEETRDSETISPPVDCITEKTKQRTAKAFDNTPTGSPQKTHMSPNRGVVELNLDGGGEYRKQCGRKGDS